jgi:hypothetical protein
VANWEKARRIDHQRKSDRLSADAARDSGGPSLDSVIRRQSSFQEMMTYFAPLVEP